MRNEAPLRKVERIGALAAAPYWTTGAPRSSQPSPTTLPSIDRGKNEPRSSRTVASMDAAQRIAGSLERCLTLSGRIEIAAPPSQSATSLRLGAAQQLLHLERRVEFVHGTATLVGRGRDLVGLQAVAPCHHRVASVAIAPQYRFGCNRRQRLHDIAGTGS